MRSLLMINCYLTKGCILLIVSVLCSCVTEYNPSNVKGAENLLIVEGVITNDTTYIRLGRSIALTEDIQNVEVVNNASVYVECSDGTLMQKTTYTYNGEYMIETGQLTQDREYRLNILLDGNHYQSEFLPPIYTAEIDSIYLTKKGLGEPIMVRLTTHDSSNQSRYYMWSYKEDWEVHAIIASEGWEHLYYCWGRDSSRVLKLGASDKLTENIVGGVELLSAPPDHNRFSYLYYIKVAQNQIRKEAHVFFTNQQKNIEQGGLFAPMPTNMRGNLTCLTDPDQYALGYIEVSTTAYIDKFYSLTEDLLYLYEVKPKPSYCMGIGEPENEGGEFIIPIECMDCTKSGATKKKPAYWPNDHE